jgi:hypothetical protein
MQPWGRRIATGSPKEETVLTESPWVRVVLGVVLLVSGVVWALQGVGVFPGNSPMNDQLLWTLIGVPTAVLGAWLLRAGLAKRG